MNVLLSVSPLIVVLILCILWRRPPFVAALCGVVLVVCLMLVVPDLNAGAERVLNGLGATGLITLQASFVIVTGLYLNALMRRTKAHEALVAWIGQLPMAPAHKQLLIVMGLAPALESLTGFGISLLVTVPLLLAASGRTVALRQSLLSMNIMPWGTLALATVVGAHLGRQPVAMLGYYSSLVSFGVFPGLAVIVGWLSAAPHERWRALRDGLLVGGMLALGLVGINWIGMTEVAGITAGLGSAAGCWLLFGRAKTGPGLPWFQLRPYMLVLGLIGCMRSLQLLGVPLGSWALTAGGVRFAPLTSPGLALLAAVLLLERGRLDAGLVRETFQRAAKPILALGGFTLMAQLMVSNGMVRIIGDALSTDQPWVLGLLSPMLGVISGYLTGSNVGGNALMMTMQSSLADGPIALTLSGIQNSSAGHAVFASMPTTLLVLAIAGPGAVHARSEESDLLRFALKVLLLVTLLLMGTSTILMCMV